MTAVRFDGWSPKASDEVTIAHFAQYWPSLNFLRLDKATGDAQLGSRAELISNLTARFKSTTRSPPLLLLNECFNEQFRIG